MKNTKTLMLAALTALSLGVGTAMAQESAGGVGSYETEQLNKLLAGQHAAAAANADAPQYGSSDRTDTSNRLVPVLTGGDGSGG
jgi:hypothetical protein